MEMKNVLDQLKAIAENNDSEDVATAIEQVDAYSFKDRLKEAESASIYDQGDSVPDDVQISNEDGDMEYGEPAQGQSFDATGVGSEEGAEVIDDLSGAADEAFDRIADRVAGRGGNDDGLGDDPWGIGDGDEEVEECGQEGSALDRVQDRAVRSGDGGPVDRVQTRHTERRSALEEELGMVFNTPMERHSWIMNQLNDLSQQLDPEDAAMVKALLKKVGNADVKGGNC